jgi:hypothetical protein
MKNILKNRLALSTVATTLIILVISVHRHDLRYILLRQTQHAPRFSLNAGIRLPIMCACTCNHYG